jgi:hypothetical protein
MFAPNEALRADASGKRREHITPEIYAAERSVILRLCVLSGFL